MSFPLLVSFFAVLSFGGLAIFLSSRLQKVRSKLETLEHENKRRAFEEKLLEEVHESIDPSLDLKKITDALTRQLENLFPCTTVSSVIVEENKLVIHTRAIKEVPHAYIEEVKESMLNSLATLEKQDYTDVDISENTTGTISNHLPKQPIASLVHLPLMIHQSVAAIITVTAIEPNAFQNSLVESMQHVLRETAKAISHLDSILQVERGKLTSMTESLPDGIFMIDMNNNLQIINPAAKQFLSLHKHHITTMDILSALPNQYDFKGKIALALHHNQSSELNNIAIKDKQLNFSLRPAHSPTGHVTGVTVLINDTTLKNSVPRMKEDFTNIIVHELRSPLTSIKASSELLISPTEFSKEEQAKLIHLIYQQSNKLLSEVQQILDAAKLEAGVFILHKHEADMKALIKDVTTVFQTEAQEKVINFIIDVDPHLPTFAFDAQQMNQVLTNVVSNSIKFTSAGGTIHLSAKQKHGNLSIIVSDTGAGIPKDKQHKLFNKFSQIENASANVGKGLGLYLVRGIMEAHGGKAEIDSDTGRGTTIILSLPMTNAAHHPLRTTQGSGPQRMVN